jgi:hypothetical protein
VAVVRHEREEDGLRALARIFVPPKSKSRWKRWSQGGSFSEPQMHETLKPSPSFKERRSLRRSLSSR